MQRTREVTRAKKRLSQSGAVANMYCAVEAMTSSLLAARVSKPNLSAKGRCLMWAMMPGMRRGSSAAKCCTSCMTGGRAKMRKSVSVMKTESTSVMTASGREGDQLRILRLMMFCTTGMRTTAKRALT